MQGDFEGTWPVAVTLASTEHREEPFALRDMSVAISTQS
jgi:hypothetical protein